MNGKLSPFHLILLVVFGALGAAGVLVFALATAGSSNGGIGPVKIWGPFPAAAVNSILRQAADTDPRLEQVTYEQKDPATYQSDLTNALASGKGPDLFIMRQDEVVRDAGKVNIIALSGELSLSAADFQNSFLESANPFLSPDGAIAVPLLVDPLVLYWNKDTLETKGFPNPPKFWDDVLTMAKTLTEKDDAGGVTKSAIAFGAYKNIADAKEVLSALILQAGGSITDLDSKGLLTSVLSPRSKSQATVNALRFYTDFADSSKPTYTWSPAFSEARQAFASGDVALYVGHASDKSFIASTNPNLNYGIAPIPQVRTTGHIVDTAHVYALATTRTSHNLKGAQTVSYIIATPIISRSFANAFNMASARRDALSAPVNGDFDVFNKQALIARSWVDPDPTKTGDAFQAMIEDTVSGSVRVDQAIERGDKQLQEIIQSTQAN